MSEKRKGFLIALAVGAVMALLVVFLNWNSNKEPVRIACDAVTLAAVLLLGYSGLVWSRNEGTFDMLTYGVSRSFKYRYRNLDEDFKEGFREYKERKAKERKPAMGSLWAGLVYMAAAVILLIVFEVMY